ncbi:PLD nuclease N-terminal domain-containing protein [Hymenobacter sp. 5516J-16]|uniref:PLD nuclease N-terminal domain-containing protein n=1 Tax=Hymenobacter sublimis TaxID=2933777 RepID=A0ABY4JBE2_9BACT|nr:MULTISPECIES: PLD nuclease N-terminal domain-containing protein [Hymenobacter]UOQ75416.1 PLD nuclease N-terminal domain-containing protein [Hymenobacter sp. 5516J-16]UPL49091.1 PLD nuclease N-terminal domain-containing protein [Hymenobacter sublimis]
MNKLVSSLTSNRSFTLTGILALLMSFALSSCGRTRNADGSLTTAGVIHLILAVYALFKLFQQPWSLGKKIVWGLIIFFFPFLGSLAFLLFGKDK